MCCSQEISLSKEGWKVEKRERVCSRIGVQCRLRVNSNASLRRAQWSTLYPCTSPSKGTAAWWREWGRARQDKGGRGKRRGRAERGCTATSVIFVMSLGFVWHTHTHTSASMASTRGKQSYKSKPGGVKTSWQQQQRRVEWSTCWVLLFTKAVKLKLEMHLKALESLKLEQIPETSTFLIWKARV